MDGLGDLGVLGDRRRRAPGSDLLGGMGLEHASDHRTGELPLVLRAHRGQAVGRVLTTLGRECLGHLLAQVAQQLLVHGSL